MKTLEQVISHVHDTLLAKLEVVFNDFEREVEYNGVTEDDVLYYAADYLCDEDDDTADRLLAAIDTEAVFNAVLDEAYENASQYEPDDPNWQY